MAQKEVNYRSLQTELEEILERLQTGELDIDAAVPAYERGMVLIKELESYLKTAENKVTKLKATLAEE